MYDKVELKKSREETHAAVQLIAAVPRCLLPHDPTDASASLIWDADLSMLTTQDVEGVRVAFDFVTQEIHLYKKAKQLAVVPTIDSDASTVLNGLKQELNSLGLAGDKLKVDLPYELPGTVAKLGQPYKRQNAEALSQLRRLYGLTNEILLRVFKSNADASEVRCWPHHYDLATLVTIEAHEDPEEAKSIGFGFSPGDGGYDEPYFYLTPWPYPSKDTLYEITTPAFWNTEGWTGGVLKASDLNSANAETTIFDFFENGYLRLKDIL